MEYVSCNLCKMDNAVLLFSAKDMNYRREGCVNVVQCRNCGLVYLNPRPGKEEMRKFYPDEYYTEKSHELAPDEYGFKGRSLIHEKISKYKQDGKILDIGCKTGEMLAELKAFGWDVYGVDISPLAAKYARERYGLEITVADFLETEFPKDQFDVVTLWQTLEHLHYPLETLRRINDIIKEDGLLVISVPNFDSFQSRIFKDKWFHLDAPRHLFHFSPKTIGVLLKKAGFHVQALNHLSLYQNYAGLRMSLLYSLRSYRHCAPTEQKTAIKNTFSLPKFLFDNCCKYVSILENLSKHGGTIEVYARQKTRGHNGRGSEE